MGSVNIYKDGSLKKIAGNASTPEVMTGATSSKNGTTGITPVPLAGQQNYVLSGDGHWRRINDTLEIADTATVEALFEEGETS